MQPVRHIAGIAAPLLRDNLNTDLMIRLERLTALQREPIGQWAFETLRYRPDGTEDPAFILNQPPWRGARILLGGRNFGVGSSREGAVWALQDFGIAAIVAPGFGDIFASNCFQNGVLPIVLPEPLVQSFAATALAQPAAIFSIDLETAALTTPAGQTHRFAIEARRRQMLLAGLDDIGLTLQQRPAIAAFQARDRTARPWIYP